MEEHLVQEIGRRFRRTPKAKRIVELREFMRRSDAHRDLIRKAFPDLYEEAQSNRSSSGGGLSGRPPHVELCAKPE
jgi:hypothetical protein